MNYTFFICILCTFFSVQATVVITQVINTTHECFFLRIRDAAGTLAYESKVPPCALQPVNIMLLDEEQSHAYIIKASLDAQQEQDFINHNHRAIACILQPTSITARTLYTCIPENPFAPLWYLGIPLKRDYYAFYAPSKQQDIFCYIPASTIENHADYSDALTRVILCFKPDQTITLCRYP